MKSWNQDGEKKAVRELDLVRIREIQAKVRGSLPQGLDSLDQGRFCLMRMGCRGE